MVRRGAGRKLVGRNRIARKHSIGRVAAEGKAGAYDASDPKTCGQCVCSNELRIATWPEAWADRSLGVSRLNETAK